MDIYLNNIAQPQLKKSWEIWVSIIIHNSYSLVPYLSSAWYPFNQEKNITLSP